jgi:hypothetical protein
MPTTLEPIDTTASFLWNMPGLDQTQFYSAAYYLSLKQRQQKGSENAHKSYLSSGMKELAQGDDNITVINVFLDRLALLFARFKHKARTPANVTATGLVIDGNEFVFYLSKNGGPSEGDETFAETLQAWFNSELGGGLEEGSGEDRIWMAMTDFWEERITHYAKQILDDVETAPSGKHAENQILSYAKLVEHFQGLERQVEMEPLERDWEQMIGLSTSLKQWAHDSHQSMKEKKKKNTKRRITFPFEAFQACYDFWRRDSRQDYPRVEYITKRFDKRIHNIEMLGLLFSTWKACYRMRSSCGSSVIKFEFIEKLPDFKLMKSELASTINRWQGSRKFAHDKPLDGLQEAEVGVPAETASGLNQEPNREPPSFTQYFHCELQMLQLFHQLKDKEPHWYIGCSKLSCYFCSRILENGTKHGQKYQTRGSHYKISPNCAFTFSLSDGMGYISEALLTVQFEMLHKVHRYAAAIKDEFTEYSDKKDTEQGRTEKTSSAMTRASRAIKNEKSSNWTKLQHLNLSEQTPRDADWVKALKLGSDGSESFEHVQIVDDGLLGYSSYEWFERHVGVQRKEFFLFYKHEKALPINQWVLGKSYQVADCWSTALKHCRFRGDLYLVLRSSYGDEYIFEDVDVMDETDETFDNYQKSMSGNYNASNLLWERTWNGFDRFDGLEEQLIQFFRKELLKAIQSEEERVRFDRELDLRDALKLAGERGNYSKYKPGDYGFRKGW